MWCCSRRFGPSRPIRLHREPGTVTHAPVGVTVEGLRSGYGDVEVLSGIDLTVVPGELLVLLGPSGCGKTTLLRAIAGLERASGGSIRIGDRVVSSSSTHVSPEDRNVGMVFQNGALFPHLTVTRNVGFGLEPAQRKGGPRVDEMLRLVGLAGFGDRATSELSGGEQQRVALARALASEPTLILMDEPFSNLDAILRERLRREVHEVVRSFGASTVFVTHDRDEAFSLADRVAVMRNGEIIQVDTPEEVYRRPVDSWVAGFVGDANFLAANVGVDGSTASTSLGVLTIDHSRGPATPNEEVLVMVRPENLELIEPNTSAIAVGEITGVEFLGASSLVSVVLTDGTVLTVRRFAAPSAVGPGQPAVPLSVGGRVGVRLWRGAPQPVPITDIR